MAHCVKISIVIPVYNAAKYLPECLDSLRNQTLEDIEIICVDDCSKDNSLEILRAYAQQDSRIQVIALTTPSSALIARKRGAEAACGEYIWFNDSDDRVALNACELLYKQIKKKKVDILQFNNDVIASGPIAQARIDLNKRLSAPYLGKLKGKEVFNKCFLERAYWIQLWNKLFDAALVKKAFTYMPDEYMPKAQDLYTYFVIAHFAESYYGWNSEPLYFYNFGSGYTGRIRNDLDTFTRYCSQYKVINALKDFSARENCPVETTEVIERLRTQFVGEAVAMWMDFQGNDLKRGWEILNSNWDFESILLGFTSRYWYNRGLVSQKLQEAKAFSVQKRPVKTVAIYYHRINVGGVQRVISLIMPALVDMGYKVVLITDTEPSEHDYPISCQYEREFLDGTVIKQDYLTRAAQLSSIVQKHQIDLVLYHAWVSPLLLWDMMVLQHQGIPMIVQTHSVFSYALISGNAKLFMETPQILSMANGITTLSKVDYTFWRKFLSNAKHMPNPVYPALLKAHRSQGTEKIVLWAGRFSSEKNLDGALNVMKTAIEMDPEIIFWVAGNNPEGTGIQKYQEKANTMGMGENVVFLGFQEDMSAFYSQSAVLLMTSRYEGYPMTLIEAKAHGVPAVIYEMPYLDLTGEDQGTISVPQRGAADAARELCALLNDRQRWQTYSDLSYQAFQELTRFDYFRELTQMFDHIDDSAPTDTDNRRMLETIMRHASMAPARTNPVKKPFLIRKVRGGFQCVADHGLWYTVKYFILVKIFRLDIKLD